MAAPGIPVASSIFGVSLVLVYATSTLFNSIQTAGPKHVLRVIDHCATYILIVNTYTPFTLVTLHGPETEIGTGACSVLPGNWRHSASPSISSLPVVSSFYRLWSTC